MASYPSTYKPSDSVLYPGADDMGGAKLTVKDIEKQREFEKKKELMTQEFRKVDRNSDAHITLDEWLTFLQTQVI